MRKILSLLGVIVLAAMLTGCGSKITKANFDRLNNDLTEAEVVALLGKPTESSSGSALGLSAGSATWKDKDSVISVQFVNGKVMSKQFGQGK